MPSEKIVELKNNYGVIDTDSFKVEHEWIPFKIEKNMLLRMVDKLKQGRTVGSFILNVLVKIIAMKQFKIIVKSLVN